MPIDFRSRDVLLCLNELGYTNITASQLKRFCHDLRKLIKFEERKAQGLITSRESHTIRIHRVQNEAATSPDDGTITGTYKVTDFIRTQEFEKYPPSPYSDSYAPYILEHKLPGQYEAQEAVLKQLTANSPCNKCSTNVTEIDEFYNTEYEHRRQVYDEIDAKLDEILASVMGSTSIDSTEYQELPSLINDEGKGKLPAVRDENVKKSPAKNKEVTSNNKENKSGKENPKISSSVIRNAPKKSTMKTDPVALYHRYKREWDKRKMPGEKPRANLRWTIRERMAQ